MRLWEGVELEAVQKRKQGELHFQGERYTKFALSFNSKENNLNGIKKYWEAAFTCPIMLKNSWKRSILIVGGGNNAKVITV